MCAKCPTCSTCLLYAHCWSEVCVPHAGLSPQDPARCLAQSKRSKRYLLSLLSLGNYTNLSKTHVGFSDSREVLKIKSRPLSRPTRPTLIRTYSLAASDRQPSILPAFSSVAKPHDLQFPKLARWFHASCLGLRGTLHLGCPVPFLYPLSFPFVFKAQRKCFLLSASP